MTDTIKEILYIMDANSNIYIHKVMLADPTVGKLFKHSSFFHRNNTAAAGTIKSRVGERGASGAVIVSNESGHYRHTTQMIEERVIVQLKAMGVHASR